MKNNHYSQDFDILSVAPRSSVERFGKFYDARPSLGYAARWKRVLDITLVLVSLPFILPVMMLIALKLGLQGGSVLYSQPRVGRNGVQFKFWKFRTMVPDADQKLTTYLADNPEAAREWARDQKLANDPRITDMGRILRKTSLDELPQLWNVLVGDMSLVGPRPFMPEQQDLYPGLEHYIAMRPGLTGLWQVSERNDVTFRQRAEMDQAYAQSLSLATDVKIIMQTLLVVVRATGR